MTGARMDMDRLQALEAEGYLRLRAEPGGGLLLANYTPRAQHGRAWDLHPELLLCRGTALGPDGTIAGRPFRKFFAMGERPGEDPASLAALGPPEATEKLDGSMVARWQDPRTGRWRCTTRGSWDSAQALAAAALLDDPGRDTRADPGLTYIYEYTGPDNRVVLRYAESRATLIGAAETATGRELGRAELLAEAAALGVRAVAAEARPDWRALATGEALTAGEDREREGWVLHWPAAGVRVKLKLPSYVRLHRVISGLGTHAVWEALAGGAGEAALLAAAPDALLPWLDRTAAELIAGHDACAARVAAILGAVRDTGLDPKDRGDRGRIAALIAREAEPALRPAAFLALDGRDNGPALWKVVEPPPGADAPIGESAARE